MVEWGPEISCCNLGFVISLQYDFRIQQKWSENKISDNLK